MLKLGKIPFTSILGTVLACSLCLAFARAHLRIQTTLIGYELGKLKTDEGDLLEKRSQLQMELAKLTTKKQLMNMANSKSDSHTAMGAYASF